MVVRLGRVLYWTGAAAAALMVFTAAILGAMEGGMAHAVGVASLFATPAFLVGLAARYVLSGETIFDDFRSREAPEDSRSGYAWEPSARDRLSGPRT